MFRNRSQIKATGFISAIPVALLLLGGVFSAGSTVAADSTAALTVNNNLQNPLSKADSRHLLVRTGFGATAAQIKALTGFTRQQAIDHILTNLQPTPSIAMPRWVSAPAPHFWTRRSLNSQDRQLFDRARDRELDELRQWWISYMLQTDSPQSERLTLFWHDHFATSYHGVARHSILMARQNQTFREAIHGDYRTLLKKMIRDPALIKYLDNQSNRKGAPNENLARELLELFTLGEGNYSEYTVKEAARALTGYGYSPHSNMSFKLTGHKRDLDDKSLFGVVGNHDGDALIDLILQQPAAAEHLARRFWHAFISDSEADPVFITSVSAVFRASGYQLMSLYQALLQSDAFWHASNRHALIKSPATLLIGASRTLDYPKQRWSQLASLHTLLGMELFAPPNVAGWSEGVAFVAPGRLLNRQLAINTLLGLSSNPLDTDAATPSNAMSGDMLANTSMNSPMLNSASMSSTSMNGSSMDSTSMSSSSMDSVAVNDPMTANADDMMSGALQVRVAAQNYKGAARFDVSLFDETTELWRSEPVVVHVGLDTQMFGNINGSSLLPWHSVMFDVDDVVRNKATHVAIAFLNDAAGDDGDRNLYVEGVQLDGQWLSASTGTQTSSCVPKQQRHAGNLYCQGEVRIPVVRASTAKVSPNNNSHLSYTASDAQLTWGRKNNRQLTSVIALEHVQTPERYFDTLTFQVTSHVKQGLFIRLNNFGCYPDCLPVWPECAWTDDNAPDERVVSFPLPLKEDNCHFNKISAADRQLVSTLWMNIESILEQAGKNENRGKYLRVLEEWPVELNKHRQLFDNNRYAAVGKKLRIDKNLAPPIALATRLSSPPVSLLDINAVYRALQSQDMELVDVLIGNADLVGGALSESPVAQNPAALLHKLVTHPAYQVY